MKNVLIIACMTMLVATLLCGSVLAGPGPAPGSGDGEPEGQPDWGDDYPWSDEGKGPAPNSGDGVSDGPGW